MLPNHKGGKKQRGINFYKVYLKFKFQTKENYKNKITLQKKTTNLQIYGQQNI
jgi:hypothetical protein